MVGREKFCKENLSNISHHRTFVSNVERNEVFIIQALLGSTVIAPHALTIISQASGNTVVGGENCVQKISSSAPTGDRFHDFKIT